MTKKSRQKLKYLGNEMYSIVYWVHFQNIHTFTYQKVLLHALLLLVLKIVQSLQCILKVVLLRLIKLKKEGQKDEVK